MRQLRMMAIFCFVLSAVTSINAQGFFMNPIARSESKKSPIDKIQFITQYELVLIQDTLSPDKKVEETMVLQVGERTSMFYSYTKYKTDSLMRKQMAQSGGVINFETKMGDGGVPANPGRMSYHIFKNHPAGKVTTLDQVGMNQFRCEETNECPEWEIVSDTMTILSYLCQKATTRFKGRDFTAWFTPEIPRNEGPWKLCGLPGLILRAEDSQQYFVFEATGLFNAQPDEMIQYGADNHEPVSMQTLNRAYERFATDPTGYITSSTPNISIVTVGSDGKRTNPRNLPYNPIREPL